MFEFTIKKQSPYLWVSLTGKLIIDDDASKMMEELSSNLNEKNNIVIIDLKELNYVNSSGFNNFLKLLTISRNSGGDLILCNINNNVNQLLITTKLNTIFKIEKNISDIQDYINKK
tara:strand:+ start:8557 stop:8904 length:348 start_codon:yes stop_codon:yes gene_type:complete